MALGTILALIGAAAAVGGAVAKPIVDSKNAKKQAAATVEAAKVSAGTSGATTGQKALSESQLLAGNPNVLNNTENTATLSGRGRLLGN